MFEAPRAEAVRRKGRRVLAIGLLLAATACSASTRATGSDGTPAGHPRSPSAPGIPKPASEFEWGIRRQLAAGTFGKWDTTHPEPILAQHLQGISKYLLVVDDGRFNFPADPNPNTDQPTGLYSVATQKSLEVSEVPDGSVLKVVGWSDNGEDVSDAHGGPGYPTWEEVQAHDGSVAWVPWVNVGYTVLRRLHQLPEIPTGM